VLLACCWLLPQTPAPSSSSVNPTLRTSISATLNEPAALTKVQARVTTAWHLEVISWLQRGGNLDLSEDVM
jgi:hypothetical protein